MSTDATMPRPLDATVARVAVDGYLFRTMRALFSVSDPPLTEGALPGYIEVDAVLEHDHPKSLWDKSLPRDVVLCLPNGDYVAGTGLSLTQADHLAEIVTARFEGTVRYVY